jgi:hypothetical protein
MIPGHIYRKLTSVRSPRYKHECFQSAWRQIQATDFEGGRPARRTLRDMAWSRARLDASEQREILRRVLK